MAANKASILRPSLRAGFRRVVQPQFPRPVTRRGYASLQERIGQSKDRPWQMAAVAVTIPGLMFLRPGRKSVASSPVQTSSQREVHTQHAAPPKTESKAGPSPQAKKDAGIRKTQNPTTMGEGMSDSGVVSTPSSSGSAEQG